MSESKWEAAVLGLVSELVTAVADGEWRQAFAAALGAQIHLYAAYPLEKVALLVVIHDGKWGERNAQAFLFRCLGGLLAKITERQFVISHLDLLFRSMNQAHPEERLVIFHHAPVLTLDLFGC